MDKNSKYMEELLAPLQDQLGMKFNKFKAQEDPKYVAAKKRNLKREIRKAEKTKSNPWKNAMDKAKGIKIKDDPVLLKKTLKKKMKAKEKSKKTWAERTAKKKKK